MLNIWEMYYALNMAYINAQAKSGKSCLFVFKLCTGFITTLHEMQTRSSDENSVRPSVCLSVCLSVRRVICDKMEERLVQIFIPYERTFILVFWEDRMVGGGRPLLREILGQPTHWNEIADFQPIIARSASAVTPSEKSSINANRKSYMGFRLVPNSVTLNDLERRNGTWSALPIN